MWKNVDAYVLGYYGMQNSGDDALLKSALYGCQQFMQLERLSYCTATPLPESAYPGQAEIVKERQLFKGQNRLSHYSNVLSAKRLIIGGGSVFHSAKDIQLKRHLMKLSSPEKSMALGVGLGPFADRKAEQQCQSFLNECGFVGVRDMESYLIANRLAPNANVKLTFDLAPLLTLMSNFSVSSEPRKGIGINLCPIPINAFGKRDNQAETEALQSLAESIKAAWEQYREPVVLHSFNDHPRFGDWRLLTQLRCMLPLNIDIHYEPYRPEPLDLVHQLSQYKVFLGMRLHSCIFAFLANTPVLALNYHRKGAQWSKQAGIPQHYQFDIQNLNQAQLTHSLKEGLEKGFEPATLTVKKAVSYSLKNWSHSYETANVLSCHSSL